ncbi:DNA alkylation repair protein OS=Lysinibacillus sphaericus OX=1421 GN=LS41612_04905 PE=4 SV=1 [Lysinibacillus sphaericus]
MSAGWSCYCWLLGNRPDVAFSESKMANMLEMVKSAIRNSPERTKSAMNNFLHTVGVSYVPLHDKALATAQQIGKYVRT